MVWGMSTTQNTNHTTLAETKLAALAAQMGVSAGHLQGFLWGVAFWMARGASFEEAVVAHGQTLADGCRLLAATR